MPLSEAQKRKLKAAGFNRKDLADLESTLDEDEDTDGPGRRRGSRVYVLEGDEAERFISGFGGSNGDDGKEPRRRSTDKAEDDETETETEDETERDEEPPAGHKYFRG